MEESREEKLKELFDCSRNFEQDDTGYSVYDLGMNIRGQNSVFTEYMKERGAVSMDSFFGNKNKKKIEKEDGYYASVFEEVEKMKEQEKRFQESIENEKKKIEEKNENMEQFEKVLDEIVKLKKEE